MIHQNYNNASGLLELTARKPIAQFLKSRWLNFRWFKGGSVNHERSRASSNWNNLLRDVWFIVSQLRSHNCYDQALAFDYMFNTEKLNAHVEFTLTSCQLEMFHKTHSQHLLPNNTHNWLTNHLEWRWSK